MAKAKEEPQDPILEELVAIKRLLVFDLLKSHTVSQDDLAAALGISQSRVSRTYGAMMKAAKGSAKAG